METVYDWITLAGFSALVVLFLQRSAAPNPPDTMWQYLPPAVGFAFANYLGNHGHALPAVGALVASLAWVVVVLKPFKRDSPR